MWVAVACAAEEILEFPVECHSFKKLEPSNLRLVLLFYQ